MGLQTKLSLGLLLVLLVLAGAFLVLTVRTSQMYHQEVQQRLNEGLAAHMVEEYPLLRSRQVNEPALETLLHQLMVVNPAIEVYVLDPEGKILAFSAPAGHVQRRRVSLGPIEERLRGEVTPPVLGDDPRDVRGSKVFDVAAIRADGRLEGYLYVVLGGEAYDSVTGMLASSYILRLSAWVGAAILLLSAIAAVVLTRRLTRPVKRLERRISRFAAEELDRKVAAPEDGGGDEVARLEAAFDELAGKIREQLGELERGDRRRRELVASVSHDLRTPLTHLQGYLDTLQVKGADLSDRERREYVEIAARHAERLGRLVNDLFELAKLDSLQAPVREEEFSVAELVRDVVHEYQLPARQRRIRLTAHVAEGRHTVVADPGLIERTLENLVDNALRHTPEEGRVVVSVTSERNGVRVEVEDTGEGIAEEDRGRIFDRFYRGSRRDDEGSGLGLAVARRAVELHRGRLQVRSQKGRGSTFSFDLPSTARDAARGTDRQADHGPKAS